MSKTKYVEFGSRGFWAYDVALEVFLKHLIDAAEVSNQANTTWLSAAIAHWRSVASIGDIGLALDSGWSASQRQTVITLAENACETLAKRERIPADEIVAWPLLDDLRIYPRGATEVLTAPVVELGRAVIALLSRTLREPPSGSAWLYGTDDGCRTLELMPVKRPLQEQERNVIVAMLCGNPSRAELITSLDAATVENMRDGGMGSIRFLTNDRRRRFGTAIAEAEYTDEDGVLVSIILNTDATGALYELDIWKVDFSPLRQYPSPSDLRIKYPTPHELSDNR